MVEPPAKRQRRADDVGHRIEDRKNGASKPADTNREREGARPVTDRPPRPSMREGTTRQRSRSRDRQDHRDRSRDKGLERRDYGDRGGRERDTYSRGGRGDGDHRDRNGRDDRGAGRPRRGMNSRHLNRGRSLTPVDDIRTERHRTRSRSPVRDRDAKPRQGTRQRSPPHAAKSSRVDDRRPDGKEVTERESTVKPATNGASKKESPVKADTTKMDVDIPLDSDEEFQIQMQKTMGFGKFRSTKNTKVPGNDKLYAVRKEKKIEYRQYMNRVGGFNRPLSPS